jgi:hypothetical protein
MVIQFLKLVTANAWRIMWKRFKPVRENAVLDTFIFAVGYAIYIYWKGWEQSKGQFYEAIYFGLGAIIAAMTVAYFWFWLSAPFRLWRKDQQKLASLTGNTSVGNIAEKIKETIQVGQKLRQRRSSSSFGTDVQIWRRTAEGVAGLISAKHRAAIETAAPPTTKPESYSPAFERRDLNTLKLIIKKLQVMMEEQYGVADQAD